MLHKFTYYLNATMLLLVILVGSCKKDDGELTPKDNELLKASTNYIEYKLNGVKYRIDGFVGGSYTDGFFNSRMYYIPPVGSIAMNVCWASFGIERKNGRVETATIVLGDLSPLAVKSYPYYGLGYPTDPYMSFTCSGNDNTGPKNENVYVVGDNSQGNIEYTRLEKKIGGRVEGKFYFTGVDLYDKDENVISTGHKITEGSFSFIMREIGENVK